MKLLVLCTSSGFGGLELYAAKVAAHYTASGLPVLAVAAPGSFLEQRLRESGVRVWSLSQRAVYLPWLAAWRLARRVRRERIDVLHLHARRDLPLAVFARLFARRRLRIVYTRQMALTRPRRGPWHRFLYRHVDDYLAITQRLAEDARRYLPLPAERIHTLYYGVPKARHREDCAAWLAARGLRQDAFRVALFGRLEPGKGQHLLIAAIGKLVRSGLAVQAAIVGRPMHDAYLQQLRAQVREAGLESAVRFADFHPNPPALMGCFDAVVLATKEETFGLVLAEAMRAGVAVVGSNAGGVPEIIEDGKTGLLFRSSDADDLADKLARLAADVAFRRRLARAGEAFADRRFSEARHFQELSQYLAGDAAAA